MNLKRTGAIAGIVITASVLGVSAAQAQTQQHDVRQSDFDATDTSAPGLNDTRSAGHLEFLKDGLHVYTTDSSSNAKAAKYFAAPAGSSLPTSGSYNWYGTDPAPGSQIVFDADNIPGNGNDYNVLVGEQVYTPGAGDGDNLTDWWLTNGSSAAAKAAAPSTSGGSGTGFHGSLQEWHDALPTAKVGYYGFSLGSGVKGDGVLRSLTFGDDQYVFTDEAAATPTTTQNVIGDVTTNKSGRTVSVDFKSDQLGAGQVQGSRISWAVSLDNSSTRYFYDNQGAGEHALYRYSAPTGQKHVLHIYKNGTEVKTVTVNK